MAAARTPGWARSHCFMAASTRYFSNAGRFQRIRNLHPAKILLGNIEAGEIVRRRPVFIGPGTFQRRRPASAKAGAVFQADPGSRSFRRVPAPGGLAANEKRHVGAEFPGDALEALHAEVSFENGVQRRKHGGCVAAPTAQAGAHGDALHDGDTGRELAPGVRGEFVRGHGGKIFLTHRHVRIVTSTRTVRPMDVSTVTSSDSEMGAMRVSNSWNPSARLLRVRKCKLTFAGARSFHGRASCVNASVSAFEKIIVALDARNTTAALRLVDSLGDSVSWIKIGLQLFAA